jgi:hypothetical protein
MNVCFLAALVAVMQIDKFLILKAFFVVASSLVQFEGHILVINASTPNLIQKSVEPIQNILFQL